MAQRFPDLTLCPNGPMDIGCEACGLVILTTRGDVLLSVIEEQRRNHHFLDCEPREWRVA